MALCGSLFVCGYALRIAELPYSASIGVVGFNSYWNATWCCFITMTTVGYGDFFPCTVIGRIIIFIVSFWGVTVVSIMVVSLTNLFSLDPAESKSMALLLRLECRDTLK